MPNHPTSDDYLYEDNFLTRCFICFQLGREDQMVPKRHKLRRVYIHRDCLETNEEDNVHHR